jgi:hypothetical protein
MRSAKTLFNEPNVRKLNYIIFRWDYYVILSIERGMRVAWTIGNQPYFNGSDKVTSVSFISISPDTL